NIREVMKHSAKFMAPTDTPTGAQPKRLSLVPANSGQDTAQTNKHLRVLFVCGDDLLHGATKMMVGAIGHTCIATTNTADAMVKYTEGNIDVVLTSNTINHHESGIDLITELRRLNPNVKTLLMTGGIDSRLLTAADIKHVLNTPFSRDALRAAIDNAASEQYK
ncbi:MAG: hypothetical protein NTY16_07890, partial [Deltaproteobacteria bacterium]|nr:hypothetical protein [Deltaproteobacteria bacterium]